MLVSTKSTFLALGFASLALAASSHAQYSNVAFDVPAIVVAQPVNPQVVSAPTMGGDLMRLRIPLSTIIDPEFRGSISEYLIEIDSPGQTMRVVDFWPRNEVYTDLEGPISVESKKQSDEHFNFGISVAYPTVGEASASGDFRNQTNLQENYQRKPPMHALTNSGTIRQGFGVFYKFRPGPIDVLEGSREIALLVEVPRGWRADMLQVHMTAAGRGNNYGSNHSQRVVATSRLWITTHREGDGAAAAQALAYVRHERNLRGLAASRQKEIDRRSTPTVWHKVGAALDIVETRIPPNYLTGVLFGPANPQFDTGTSRLPVDLRVAILDYWDARAQVLNMARPA